MTTSGTRPAERLDQVVASATRFSLCADAQCARWRVRSEPEFRSELHHTWLESGRDRPEAGRAEPARRWSEIRGVQQVEHLQPQLDRALAAEPDAAHHGEINVFVCRSPYRIARSGSDRGRIDQRERG